MERPNYYVQKFWIWVSKFRCVSWQFGNEVHLVFLCVSLYNELTQRNTKYGNTIMGCPNGPGPRLPYGNLDQKKAGTCWPQVAWDMAQVAWDMDYVWGAIGQAMGHNPN